MKIIGPDDQRCGSLFNFPPEVVEKLERLINDAIETTERGTDVVLSLGTRVGGISTGEFPATLILTVLRRCTQAGWADSQVEGEPGDPDTTIRLVAPKNAKTKSR